MNRSKQRSLFEFDIFAKTKKRECTDTSQGEPRVLAIFHTLTKLNYLSTLYVGTSVLRWAGWATLTYGRVGKLKTRMGKRKKNFPAPGTEFYQTNVCLPWPETLPAALICSMERGICPTAALYLLQL